tara:strand:- start:1634 stop:1891 length:258 start_codon:yes stop_codon:yes gene_type:complete
MNKSPTVKSHISNMIKWYWNNRKIGFRTRDIQSLSERGEKLYGRRLGSPSTYDRVFREMKEKGDINVEEQKTKTDSLWLLRGHSL